VNLNLLQATFQATHAPAFSAPVLQSTSISAFVFTSCSPLLACCVSKFFQQYSTCYCDSSPTGHLSTCIKCSSISKHSAFNGALSDLLCTCFSVISTSSISCSPFSLSPRHHHERFIEGPSFPYKGGWKPVYDVENGLI